MERERDQAMERERSGYEQRDPAMERERERERERSSDGKRDPAMERERDPVMEREREVSWSAMGGGFGGRGWAEDFGRERF